ncbi:hypothetical protein B0T18DRAFT_95715 [Schizothecium vesticola]|uniref:Uncharacterized protein n=1 Tax=Schizothecium vesticola TaxID=314040 RepID=A0AA40K7M2_9PEZI|nr:hypothetical protein B0T18DRAFT_95715 [Schizothecium vesticola]
MPFRNPHPSWKPSYYKSILRSRFRIDWKFPCIPYPKNPQPRRDRPISCPAHSTPRTGWA